MKRRNFLSFFKAAPVLVVAPSLLAESLDDGVMLNSISHPSVPPVSFGDSDTGFYQSNDELKLAVGGVTRTMPEGFKKVFGDRYNG